MKFLRFAARSIKIIIRFFSNCVEMRLMTKSFPFFLKQPQFFTKTVFEYLYPDLLKPLAKSSQNHCMCRTLRYKM